MFDLIAVLTGSSEAAYTHACLIYLLTDEWAHCNKALCTHVCLICLLTDDWAHGTKALYTHVCLIYLLTDDWAHGNNAVSFFPGQLFSPQFITASLHVTYDIWSRANVVWSLSNASHAQQDSLRAKGEPRSLSFSKWRIRRHCWQIGTHKQTKQQ